MDTPPDDAALSVLELVAIRLREQEAISALSLKDEDEVDTPELRDALVDRLTESDMELRGEALVGLALRKDPRVLEPLRRELESSEVGVLAVEAAQALEDVSLLPLLLRLQDPPGEADSYFRGVLADAIAHLEGLAR